ncbi:MAG: family 1 glycosylhydrolase [Lactobacillaceae bacterium]|jgi:beta-glucosidase|nr:family 1 glycosylhydrolase [Lactobacillaceae bacterium]
MEQVKFPADFLWGASIATYQTDGADNTQWHAWEVENANQLAANYETAFAPVNPGYQAFLAEAKDQTNYVAGTGIEHRKHYATDFDLLAELNFNAFRFSVEWARIEPVEGQFDQAEIAYLKTYLHSLKAHGIKPVLSLWHWTMPTWFTDKGAFEHKANLKYWDRFVRFVLTELQADVDMILTLNEWNVYTFMSYIAGEWVPNQTNFVKGTWVAQNLVWAHQHAYKIAKEIKPAFQVSVAHNTSSQYAGDTKLNTKFALAWNTFQRDSFFLRQTYKYMDFLGVNWYNTDTFIAGQVQNPNTKINDLGWDMRPGQINLILEQLYAKYHLPILITENGLADADDSDRQWWLEQTFTSLHTAMEHGVEIVGYLHWSAFDNFEWDKGFWPKFGLIAVDRQHDNAREIRPSARWYATFIAAQQGK